LLALVKQEQNDLTESNKKHKHLHHGRFMKQETERPDYLLGKECNRPAFQKTGKEKK
jgi:hypothetical protein